MNQSTSAHAYIYVCTYLRVFVNEYGTMYLCGFLSCKRKRNTSNANRSTNSCVNVT